MLLVPRIVAVVALAAGGLQAQVVLGPGIVSPSSPSVDTRISTVDLDDDGDLDLVSLNFTLPQVRFGDGRGHFGPGLLVEPQVGMDGVDAGDVDGDGHPDLVGARTGKPFKQFYVLSGHGGEDFDLVTVAAIAGPANQGGGAVRLSDADGDGDLDALILTSAAETATTGSCLFVNDGGGQFVLQPVSAGDVVDAGRAADLNADGLPDVVQTTGFFLAASQIHTHVLLGQPGGAFAESETWPETKLLELADLDLDGNLDALTLGTTNSALRTRLGTGDGGFADAWLTLVPSWGPGFVLADFDGDGVLDLFAQAGPPKEHHVVRLGDGRGGFAAANAVELALHTTSSNDLLPADVIPGGLIELVTIVEPFQSKAVKVYENWTYPAGGPLLDLGHAKPGAQVWPILKASGTFAGGDAAEFRLFLGLPSTPTVLVAGLSEAFVPFHGGTLVPAPDFVVGPVLSDLQGGAEVQMHWPAGVPSGVQLTLQYWMAGPSSSDPSAASTAVRVTAP